MTLDEYMKRLRKDLDKFESDMKEYQNEGNVPEDMYESEWYKQYLASMGIDL